VNGHAKQRNLATVIWEGNSREILQRFPDRARQNLGFELWRLQLGEKPIDYRPLPSLGMGVFELREQDERGWYRIIYLSRVRDAIHVLHCFEKKSREMPRKDFEIAKRRFKEVKARLTKGAE
jgi:phage-related protein